MTDHKFTLSDGKWVRVSINENEALELLKYLTKHVSCRTDIQICVSGASGIGQNVVVECRCGVQEDITDYDSW